MHPRTWQLYGLLMLASLASAVFLPLQVAGFVRSSVQFTLIPIAVPLRVTAAWAWSEAPPAVEDAEGLRRENEALRRRLVLMTTRLDDLATLEAERKRLGAEIADQSVPMKVMSGEAGSGDLMLVTTPGSGVETGQPVFYGGDLVGKVREAGIASARVRTIVHKDSVINVSFGSFVPDASGVEVFQPRPLAPVAVRGTGSGLRVEQLKAPGDTPPVAVGDWAVLNDPADWPRDLSGVRVGTVTEVHIRPDAPQVVEVILTPAANLRTLLEVMVLVR